MTVVKQITSIEAPADGNWVANVTATFEAEESDGTPGDWGTGVNARLFKTQNASTTNGDSTPVEAGGARHPYTLAHEFALVASHTITIGIDCVLSGPHSVNFYAIKIRVVLVKR